VVSRPLVSIVTPTLNQGRFIEQTIRSIKNQTYGNVEHIVVDGGSTDGTLDILRRYDGTYNLHWLSEPDRGMYDAINKGMRLATGDVLAYLNSDDLYFPWTLEVVVDQFERHPDADLVCGDTVRLDSVTRSEYLLFQPPPFADYVRRSGFLAQPAVFWRNGVRADIGDFDDSLRYVADCDFWMRAVASHHLIRIDEFLAVDRIQGAAHRSANANKVLVETAAVRERYVRLGGLAHHARRLRNRLWGGLWRRILWVRLLSRRRRDLAEGPWARWLALPGLRISLAQALLAQLPLAGERFALRAVHGAVGTASEPDDPDSIR
jgi:glycosyltransferase involved in cell wall biosynthesis